MRSLSVIHRWIEVILSVIHRWIEVALSVIHRWIEVVLSVIHRWIVVVRLLMIYLLYSEYKSSYNFHYIDFTLLFCSNYTFKKEPRVFPCRMLNDVFDCDNVGTKMYCGITILFHIEISVFHGHLCKKSLKIPKG